MTPPLAPPRLAQRVLSAVLGSREAADAILGDLHEEHAVRARQRRLFRWRVRMLGCLRGSMHRRSLRYPAARHGCFASGRSRRDFLVTETPS